MTLTISINLLKHYDVTHVRYHGFLTPSKRLLCARWVKKKTDAFLIQICCEFMTIFLWQTGRLSLAWIGCFLTSKGNKIYVFGWLMIHFRELCQMSAGMRQFCLWKALVVFLLTLKNQCINSLSKLWTWLKHELWGTTYGSQSLVLAVTLYFVRLSVSVPFTIRLRSLTITSRLCTVESAFSRPWLVRDLTLVHEIFS